MKHIKTFEELKPMTYLSAADKLTNIGHKKRPAALRDWVTTLLHKNTLNSIKTIGSFTFRIENFFKKQFTGNFYVYLSIDSDMFYDQLDRFKEGERVGIPFDVAFIPVDDESKKTIESLSYGSENGGDVGYNSRLGIYFVSRFYINLTTGVYASDGLLSEYGIKKPINKEDLKGQVIPNSYVDFEDTHEVYILLDSRKDAVRFKKALYDIFNVDVEYRSTPENPGGLKDELFDIFDENNLDLGDIYRFISSLKKINVNKLYKD